jgi:2,3-bisphosphoglycerate-independent phosphoglycerate mutase
MLEDDGSPHTAHTSNPVPLVATDSEMTLVDGELSDLAPTAFSLLGIAKPLQMPGKILSENRE